MDVLRLSTPRLELVAATTASFIAAREAEALARMLSCSVPNPWPPLLIGEDLDFFIEQSEKSSSSGWLAWWWILVEPGARTFIGSGGFMGDPREDGFATIGFEVEAPYQRKGYCTEATKALVKWAFKTPEVGFVDAFTSSDNPASIRVLNKAGFVQVEQDDDDVVRLSVTRDTMIPD